MKNFGRVLKIACQFRWTVAGTFTFSLLVAVLWGGNIGALYPVIQVAFQGRSLQAWIDDEIQTSETTIDRYEKEIAQTKQQLFDATAQRTSELKGKLNQIEFDLTAEHRVLAARERIRPVIYRLFPNDPFQTVVVIVICLVFATFLKGIFMFANTMCVARLEQHTTFEIRRQFYHQALRLDLAAYGEERTSGMLSRFNTDISYATSGLKNLFGSAVREPLKMLACLIGASLISWRLLVFSLFFAPIVALLIRKLAGSIKRANRRVLEEITQLYGVLTETFNGIQTVQAYTLEQRERKKFYRVARECLKKAMRISFYSALAKPITETLGIAMISLALVAGAYLTLNQETHLFGIRICDRPLDVPSLLVFYGLLIGTTEPGRKLSEIFNSIQAGIAASDRLFPLLDMEPSIQAPQQPVALPRPHHRLEFEDIRFHYDEGSPILEDINLSIKFGETIAIVGPNGCGKSTLAQMIPRFFDPVEGSLAIDGVDVRQVRLRDLRKRIGFVTQQSILFDDSVFSNIQSGRLNATESEVIEAARKARAHRFITEKLIDGYETNVGAGGSRLSGGQRQRIALARAILRDPEILILDEATSQIDLESEQLIHQALEEFKQGRTVIMITHRLASLDLADRIIVMDAGRISDCGTHDELINRCGLYQRLYSIHFQKSA
ncbi:MAG: ABC transporter ATP-binding protein [Pirellulaceae bacterium]|nr:ABC transporter ATP-binding protein [Pirellulaceae bacterium]